MTKKILFAMLCMLSILSVTAEETCSSINPIDSSSGYIALSDDEMALIEGDGLGGAILCSSVATVGVVAGTALIYATAPWIVHNYYVDIVLFTVCVLTPSAAWKWGYNNLSF